MVNIYIIASFLFVAEQRDLLNASLELMKKKQLPTKDALILALHLEKPMVTKGDYESKKSFETRRKELNNVYRLACTLKTQMTKKNIVLKDGKVEEEGQPPFERKEEKSKKFTKSVQPKPVFQLKKNVWACQGCDHFKCLDSCKIVWFFETTNLTIGTWLLNHKLLPNDCNRCKLKGKGKLIAYDDGVAMVCEKNRGGCGFKSVGGRRGIWRFARISLVENLLLFYAISERWSYKALSEVFDGINKNTWSVYVKTVGMILGEEKEIERRARKYKIAQLDETAFGTRKHHRGKRPRLLGIQWALTMLEINNDGKPTGVDIRFLPNGKRGVEQISEIATCTIEEGGTILTDYWRAYLGLASKHNLVHKRVNHSKHFKDPTTGNNTNAIEGIHGVLKKESRLQFNKLPSVTINGDPHYLDLICWRVNGRLMAKSKGEVFKPFKSFCGVVKRWHEREENLDGCSQKIDMSLMKAKTLDLLRSEEEDDTQVCDDSNELVRIFQTKKEKARSIRKSDRIVKVKRDEDYEYYE